jgi:microcystin-dependent protein
MALETASFIDSLNPSNPSPTDLLGQGDDHIRLIKAVLKATFPNIAGAVSLSDSDLNALPTNITEHGVPFGLIAAWYGSAASVPTGWAICDGSTVAKSDGSGNITVPDLRNQVIMGAGSVAAQGTAFGAASISATTAAAGAHSHSTKAGEGGHAHTGISVKGHALTISEMPAHDHDVPYMDSGSGSCIENATGSATSSVKTSKTGGGQAHSHDLDWPATPDGVHTHTTDEAAAHKHGVTIAPYQPSLALHYIMKV